METLIAVAVAVGLLSTPAARPAEVPRASVEQPKAKEKVSSRPAPILGY
jgi:hypothetical protein